jgi:hypothetical protein
MPGQAAIGREPDGSHSVFCGLCKTDPPSSERTRVGKGFNSDAKAEAFVREHAQSAHRFGGVVTGVPSL